MAETPKKEKYQHSAFIPNACALVAPAVRTLIVTLSKDTEDGTEHLRCEPVLAIGLVTGRGYWKRNARVIERAPSTDDAELQSEVWKPIVHDDPADSVPMAVVIEDGRLVLWDDALLSTNEAARIVAYPWSFTEDYRLLIPEISILREFLTWKMEYQRKKETKP